MNSANLQSYTLIHRFSYDYYLWVTPLDDDATNVRNETINNDSTTENPCSMKILKRYYHLHEMNGGGQARDILDEKKKRKTERQASGDVAWPFSWKQTNELRKEKNIENGKRHRK